VLDQLASGELDLVLAGSEVETTLSLDREVMRSRIISEPFWCVMAHDNPAATEELTLAAYLAAPHVVTSMVGEESYKVDASLTQIGASRRKAVTVPSFLAAAWYAASSDMMPPCPKPSAVEPPIERMG
jgi:DNA-binding transcriptional LysR family regulator